MTLATAGFCTVSHLAQAQVYQPHMQAALQDLYAAQREILAADANHDHGGWAGRATNKIDAAISDVQNGIAYRNTLPP